jgi:addiction module HigA family antidote
VARPGPPGRDPARRVPEAPWYRLARDISVPPRRIYEIVHGTRAITADTALRLGRYFKTSGQFWLNLQSRHDLEVETDRLRNRLDREVKVLKRAE